MIDLEKVKLTQQAQFLIKHLNKDFDVDEFKTWWIENRMLAGGSDLQDFLRYKDNKIWQQT